MDHLRYEDMAEEERAERFAYFTREQLLTWMRAWGLPEACTDPATLRSAARVQAAAERRIAAERDAAATRGERAAGQAGRI